MVWASDAPQGIFSLPTPPVGEKIYVVLALKRRNRKGARAKHTRWREAVKAVEVETQPSRLFFASPLTTKEFKVAKEDIYFILF